MSHTAFNAEISRVKEHKEESLNDPNGVLYMDHIWEAVKDQEDLSVVLRTDDEVYTDIPVRAWWRHGFYDWEDPSEGTHRSQLTFEVPDEVSLSIQSQYAECVLKRFFGLNSGVELEGPFLGESEDASRLAQLQRNPRYLKLGENYDCETIVDSWPRLKDAIKQTASYTASYLGGQTLRVLSTAGEGSGLARVREDQLQIYLPDDTIAPIQNLWAKAFQQEISPPR